MRAREWGAVGGALCVLAAACLLVPDARVPQPNETTRVTDGGAPSPRPASSLAEGPIALGADASVPSAIPPTAAAHGEIDWTGNYGYSEHAPPDETWDWQISVSRRGGAWRSRIDIDGFQTLTRIIARGVERDGNLDLEFQTAGAKDLFSAGQFQVGQTLITLARMSDGSIWAEFGAMRPKLGKARRVQLEKR